MAVAQELRDKITNQSALTDAAYNDLQTAINTRDSRQAAVDELERQLQVHLSTGDVRDANIVSGQLVAAKGYLTEALTNYTSALQIYKKDLADYLNLKNQLSPADRAIQDNLDSADAALSGTGNVNSVPTSNPTPAPAGPKAAVTSAVNYFQAHTKQIIIGGIIIVVIIIGAIVIIRLRKKSAAPAA